MIDKMISIYNLKKDNQMLEIGSNDGFFIDEFKKKNFNNIYGVEPSRDVFLQSKKKGHKVINKFFSNKIIDKEFKLKKKFDLIYSRQVLEHITNLNNFLAIIQDADILSGWNSEGYDIPYTVNRVARILGKQRMRDFCLWDQYPRKREYEKFGREQETFDLLGRVHLDYMELYRRYTYHEIHSYRLDAVGEYEIGENKVPYEGTLDQLYNNDYEKFIACKA